MSATPIAILSAFLLGAPASANGGRGAQATDARQDGDAGRPRLVIDRGLELPVESSAFSPDERFVALSLDAGGTRVVVTATGEILRTLAGSSPAWHPRALKLATIEEQVDTVHLWDVQTGRELARRVVPGASSVSFSADARFVIVERNPTHSVEQSSTRILGARTLKDTANPDLPPGTAPPVLSHDARYAAIELYPTGCLLRRTAGGPLRTIDGNCVGFSERGDYLLTDSGDELRVWSVPALQRVGTMQHPPKLKYTARNLGFEHPGTVDVIGIGEHSALLRRHHFPGGGLVSEETIPLGADERIDSISRTTALAVRVSAAGDVAIGGLRSRSGERVLTVRFGSLDFWLSEDGQTLVTKAGTDGGVVWDLGKGGAIAPLRSLAAAPHEGVLFLPSRRDSARHVNVVKVDYFQPDANAFHAEIDVEVRGAATWHALDKTEPGELEVASTPDGAVTVAHVSGRYRLVRAADHSTLATLDDDLDLDSLSLASASNGWFAVGGDLSGSGRYAAAWNLTTGERIGLDGHNPVLGKRHLAVGAGYPDDREGLYLVALPSDPRSKLEPPVVRALEGHRARPLAFGEDDAWLAVAVGTTIHVVATATGNELTAFDTPALPVRAAARPDGLLVASEADGAIRIWRPKERELVATLVPLSASDWVVFRPNGAFDASPGGMQALHWVVGLEPIALEQLKKRFYEPGLLGKALGVSATAPRDVAALEQVKLFPEATLRLRGTSLTVVLDDRGGGIGRVQVFVEGKEIEADARGPSRKNLVQNGRRGKLQVDLSKAPFLPGQENEIRVVTWNEEGYLSSRGVRIHHRAPKAADTPRPELHAVVVGVSDYASSGLGLSFSARDATDFAAALELAANKLFTASHVHLLATGGPVPPTKNNIREAFQAVANSRPQDVLVVYLSGHGVTWGQDGYAFLTSEARATDVSDPAVRDATAVTSAELTEWSKHAPALKQLIVLDTCAAGAAQAKLGAWRSAPEDQVLALDRMKDRTGLFVLMGSAADAVSYEASRFGQGLLTYAVLQGMQGAALESGSSLVDVGKLIRHAETVVPDLAVDVGGIQKPVVMIPRAGSTFYIGILEAVDRRNIVLQPAKPIVLRPTFIDVQANDDSLATRVRGVLRRLGAPRGGAVSADQPRLVYLDDAEVMRGAIRAVGSYSRTATGFHVSGSLRKDDARVRPLDVDVPGDLDAAAEGVAHAIAAAAAEL